VKATLIYRFEQDYDDGAMVRMVIWKVSAPVPPATHPFKYRLVYLEEGKRVVGLDNERGKGDHRHAGKKQMPYAFVDVETLVNDFVTAVKDRRNAR